MKLNFDLFELDFNFKFKKQMRLKAHLVTFDQYL